MVSVVGLGLVAAFEKKYLIFLIIVDVILSLLAAVISTFIQNIQGTYLMLRVSLQDFFCLAWVWRPNPYNFFHKSFHIAIDTAHSVVYEVQ